ncbi:hypothetical protein [Roseibium sp.]|uniref:hypothetical protein n=1 Tax=Roseibium sp. TaxID=1936156 RepID=UPI003A974B4C
MSRTVTRPASQAPAPAKPNLENQYKPVGIAAVNAATMCKSQPRSDQTGKK